MAKVKNKRNSGLADKVHKKRKVEINKKKLNPFEVHINKEKIKVLGQKSKHDRGLPGVSRAKAVQKRKETLGTEMKLMNKTNTFIDHRIGEKNNQLSAEDRMIARFAAERAKQHGKRNIFNLADDEVLTHRGQTLEQIEKFEDPRSDDEEDEPGKKFGGLDDDFVSQGHFGGGILSKTEQDGAKSHKDLIEQLIAESKKRKAEKQKEKEQTLDLTEKLDSEWKDLQPVVFKRPRMEEKESIIDKLLSQAEQKSSDYDKMMRELKFDRRGTPSDGLKNDEKTAKEEKERLAQLEKERELRMIGEVEELKQTAPKHRSADDLDDNYVVEDETEYMLAYDKDGKPLVPEDVLKNFTVPGQRPKFSEDSTDDEEEEDDIEEEVSGEEGEEEDEQEKEQEEEEDESEKEPEKEEVEAETKDEIKELVKEWSESEPGIKVGDKKEEEEEEEGEGDEEECEEEEAEEESEDEHIVSFFDVRSSEEGEKLKELLSGKTPAQQATAIQKLIKSYDPGLAENNKDKLTRLFAHMLQYVNDIFTSLTNEGDVLKAFLIFDRLAPYFYDLSQANKVSTKKLITELLKEKHDIFKKNTKKVPDLDTLIFFKLVSLLYPTSDFRHPVATPSLTFMSEILTLARFNNAYSVSRGLFIVALVLEYTFLSKRLVPPAINFIRGILYLAANTSILNPIQVVPPFRLHKDAKILNLEDNCSKMEVGFKMAAKDFVLQEIDNEFKIRCLLCSTMMLKEFFGNFNDLEAQECMFEAHLQLLGRVDLDLYPKKVASMVLESVQYMKEGLEVKTYTPLSREKKKPKMLRLFEPDVQEVFTGSKSSKLSREQADRARMIARVKRERKGAMREIRRDRDYVASVKLRDKIRSDNVRKEKVKQIYKDAAIQQGELNQLKRKK